MSAKSVTIPVIFDCSDEHDLRCSDGEVAVASGFPTDEDSTSTIEIWDGNIPVAETETFSDNPYPPLQATFSLQRTGLPPYSPSGDDYPELKLSSPANPDDDERRSLALAALDAILRDAEMTGHHTSPFLICAAWRLDDGSHTSPTAPELLIPNAGNILMRLLEGESDGNTRTMVFTALLRICRAGISVAPPASPLPSDISGIDIFTTPAIPHADTESLPAGPQTLDGAKSFTISATRWGDDREENPATSREKGFRFAALPDSDIADRLLKSEFRLAASLPLDVIGNGYIAIDTKAGGGKFTPDYLCHSRISPKGHTAMGYRRVAWGGKITFPAAVITTRIPCRFLFHPDRGVATAAVTVTSTGETFRCPLTPHPSLYGSYYFRGFTETPVAETYTGILPSDRTVECPGMVMASRSRHRDIFDSANLNIGIAGEVLHVSEAHKTSTVSTYAGKMIYLFTPQGVYLAGMDDDSPFRLLGLLGGQKCLGQVTPMENGVAFVATGGIYQALPTKTVCLTDSLVGQWSRERRQQWLSGVRIGYDFPQRRLIASGPDGDYALHAEADGWKELVMRGPEDVAANPGFTTRPLKFGDCNIRKSITMLEICGCSPASWRLEGSDNLTDWETETEGMEPTCGLTTFPRYFWRVSVTVNGECHPGSLFLRISYIIR